MSRYVALCVNETSAHSLVLGRVVEIGAVEFIGGELTGNNFHVFINPETVVEAEAIEKHGIGNEFLLDKPLFKDICESLINYLSGAQVITFGEAAINLIKNEIKQLNNKLQISSSIDYSLKLKKQSSGIEPSIKSYCIYHGISVGEVFSDCLLEAELLADLYICLEYPEKSRSVESFHFETFRDIDQFVDLNGKYALYRGICNEDYELIPSLFRIKKGEIRVEVLENVLISRFKKQSISLLSQHPTSLLQWLVIAQHHGLPTRLLDWTLNPLVAAFFSAYKEPKKNGVIYSYEPNKFSNEDQIDIDNLVEIKQFYPSQINSRIKAQSGIFTIHPTSSSKLISTQIKRIIIPANKKNTLLEKLAKYGVNYSSLFPDLDGISKNLRDEFGYWVSEVVQAIQLKSWE